MRALLVLGGDPPAREALEQDRVDLVVATDGGAASLVEAGARVDRIIGDMDSLPPALAARAEEAGVTLDRHPRDKAETDGELAMRWLIDRGAREVRILGGHGGRSAMFLTHIRLLQMATEHGIDAWMEGANETLRVLGPGAAFVVDGPATVDLIAITPARVGLEGFRYEGADIALTPWTGQGVSNVVAAQGTVTVHEGSVLIVIERPAAAPEPAPDPTPA